jgi:hypothetical protein
MIGLILLALNLLACAYRKIRFYNIGDEGRPAEAVM